jgi:hypothetical protein
MIVILGCSKEPSDAILHSTIPPGSDAAFENPAAFLMGLSFTPDDKPLNNKDMAALSTIILSTTYGTDVQVDKSWPVYRIVDISLAGKREWQRFVKTNAQSDSVHAASLGEVIAEILDPMDQQRSIEPSTSGAPLMEAAERLAAEKADFKKVLAVIGEPLTSTTNSTGEIILQYILDSGKEEQWRGTRCAGATIVISGGQVSEVHPILTR